MNRLFGAKKTGPKPTLSGAIQNVLHYAYVLYIATLLLTMLGRHPYRDPRRQACEAER